MVHNDKLEEKLLRFAVPALYQKMIEIFSSFNIHAYDVHGTVMKKDDGLDVTLRFSTNFFQEVTTHFSLEQALNPDDKVEQFFKETAETCKSQLISDYYKMIKL